MTRSGTEEDTILKQDGGGGSKLPRGIGVCGSKRCEASSFVLGV